MHIRVRQAGALAFFRPAFISLFFVGFLTSGWTHSSNAQPHVRCNPWAAKLVSLEGKAEWRAKGTTRWQAATPDLHFCVGDTLKVRDSRAALRLPNDTVVRLKEKTTLKFVAPRESLLMELLQGAAHFISRTPRRFEVKTPYLNAAVDGTEFLLAALEKTHRVAVFEGLVSVSSQWGATALNSGEQISVNSASAPHSPVRIKLRESVDWALYYPPIVIPENTPPTIEQALDRGQIEKAVELLSKIDDRQKTADDYSLLAALALYRGRTEAARKYIAKARALSVDNPTALALESIMSLVAGQPEQAQASAEALVIQQPHLAAPYLALSYAQQSQFQLPAALASAEKAVELQPENGLLHARLAELALMLGDQARADRHGELAVKFSPALSRTHSIRGFAALNRLALSAAQNSFARATELDPADPLPQMGLGLISIRRGNLGAGREKIELAVALDPGSALLRSYLGKAYYEEKRNTLADPQYSLARELDPEDPTPWFYQALRKQSDNELLPALEDLDKAIELNDNRAVYRSRLLLDKDAAARSASQARIYTAIQFDQLAVLQGANAVAQAPQEHSSHRLLTQAYADRPRFETLRASERLQARLLQPLGAQPLPLGLGEPGLMVQPGAGPNDLGLNEFNSLFVQEGISGHASVLMGTQDTEAFDWHVGGLYSRAALELGQYQYSSDGFRENNDVNYTLYNAFGHFQISGSLGVQIELRRREDEQGDVTQRFFEDRFFPDLREEAVIESYRLGLNYQPSSSSLLLATFIDRDAETEYFNIFSFAPVGSLNLTQAEDVESQQSEVQYQFKSHSQVWLIGTSYFDSELDQFELANFITLPPFPPPPPGVPSILPFDTQYSNSYIYTSLQPWQNKLDLTVGLGYTEYDSDSIGKNNYWNPKFGVKLHVTPNFQIRASAFKALKGPFELEGILEPTHLAEFPSLFDDGNFSRSRFYGMGFDFDMGNQMRIGMNINEREIKKPVTSNIDPIADAVETTEISAGGYFYYPVNERWSISAEFELENFRRAKKDVLELDTPAKLKTYQLPLQSSYFFSNRLSFTLAANYIRQTVEFSQPDPVLEPNKSFFTEQNDFWVVDFKVEFRLPNRRGLLSLEARNLFDKDFKYHDVNFQTNDARPQLITPEQTVLGRLAIYF